MKFRIEKMSSQEWAQFRKPWNQLLKKSRNPQPFLTWEWMWSWWCAFSNQSKSLILKILNGTELLGIAPLCIKRNEVQFASSADLYPNYMDVFIAQGFEKEAIQSIMKYLLAGEEWEKIRLGPPSS